MKRFVTGALLALVSAPGVAATPAQADVDRAIQAMGGQGVFQVRTIVVKGRVRQLEPDQSHVAGGEFRLAGDTVYTQSRDLVAGKTRTEWSRKLLYPGPREFNFTEVIADGVGWVNGVDSIARTKQNRETNQHTMSGVRLAATSRELLRSSPVLLVDMQQYPARLTKLPDQKVGNATLPAVRYQGERNVREPVGAQGEHRVRAGG